MAASVHRAVAVQLPLQVALLLGLGACARAPAPAPTPPAATHTEPEAFDLARRVLVSIGYDQLPQVAQLDFRLVYFAGADPVFSAEHHWDLVGRRDRIVWVSPEGERYDAVLHLVTGRADGFVNGVRAEGEAQARLTQRARRRFATDTHHLVMPMRLFAPDAHLVLSGAERVDGRTFEVLEVRSEDPNGPTLRLFVDPEGLRVHRSELAEGSDPGARRVATWGEYRPVGPLLLPHEHRLDGGDRRTVLEDVLARREVDHLALLPSRDE